jgi:hypothetical protein
MTKYEPNHFQCEFYTKSRKSEPLAAGALAMKLMSNLLSPEQKDTLVLDKNKSQILPGKLQEKAKIVALSNGTLILKANSSVWRAEIAALKSNIVVACNKILGRIAVKTVKIG